MLKPCSKHFVIYSNYHSSSMLYMTTYHRYIKQNISTQINHGHWSYGDPNGKEVHWQVFNLLFCPHCVRHEYPISKDTF